MDASSVTQDLIIDLVEGQVTGATGDQTLITAVEQVFSGSGNDVIIMSVGEDVISGGAGNDVFVFGSLAAIGNGPSLADGGPAGANGPGGRDVILDFAVGDRIDISALSAQFSDILDTAFADTNIRRFVIIDQLSEFSQPGQLRTRYEEFEGRQFTILEGNMDSDADAEFQLELVGEYNVNDDYFRWQDGI